MNEKINKEETKTVNHNITVTHKKPKGNVGVLVLWILFFWPVAIWYGFSKDFSSPSYETTTYSYKVEKNNEAGDK